MKETLSGSNIWNSIEGYPLYEVSYNGEVRKIGGKVLKQSKTSRGYLCVRLSNENGTRTHNVHKLVAQAFIMRNKGTFEVNHKDGNKTNNRADNLEWVTHRENILHREYVLKKNAWGKPARPVFCLETGEEYPSITLAARQVGVSPNTMLQSCKNGGKIKGLTWNFIKN